MMARVQVPFAFQRVSSSGAVVAAANASVLVKNRNTNGTSGSNATVYGTATGGSVGNPVSADANGRIVAWLAPGPYNLEVTVGSQSYTVAWDGRSADDPAGHVIYNSGGSLVQRDKVAFLGSAIGVADNSSDMVTEVTVDAITTVNDGVDDLPKYPLIAIIGEGCLVGDEGDHISVEVPGLAILSDGTPVTPQQYKLNFINADVADDGTDTTEVTVYNQTVHYDTDDLPQQPAVEFAGTGVVVTDDTTNHRTVVTVDAYDDTALDGRIDALELSKVALPLNVPGDLSTATALGAFVPSGAIRGFKAKIGTGTSVGVVLSLNGTNIETVQTVTTTATEFTYTAPIEALEGDDLEMTLSALVGTPEDLTLTVFYTL